MKIVFEASTTQYDEDKIQLIKALSHLQTLCQTPDAYHIGNPVSKFGWTFFTLWIKPSMLSKIEEKFSDMIKKAKGQKNDEKLTNFLTDFFASKGCKIRLKLVETD